MSDATEIMYAAAERFYKENGERHGYSGVVNGCAAVLRAGGFNIDGMELSKIFHDPLSDFHDKFAGGETTFEEIARAVDLGPRGAREVRLPHPFGDIMKGRFPYPTGNVPEVKVDVSWMASEVEQQLKKEKIKKGSKRYKEFIAANASKILEAARREAEKAKEEARRRYEKVFKELDGYHDKAIAERDAYQRRADARHAFIEAAGLPGDARMNNFESAMDDAWTKVASSIEEHAAYLELSLNSLGSEDAALYALASSEKLKPFTEVS